MRAAGHAAREINTRIIHNTSRYIRRYDALAKLISPNQYVTECTAVAITERGIFISANEPKHLTAAQCTEILRARFTRIQQCLNDCMSSADSKIRSEIIARAIDDLGRKHHYKMGKFYDRRDFYPKDPTRTSIKTSKDAAIRSLSKLVESVCDIKRDITSRQSDTLTLDECNHLLGATSEQVQIFTPSARADGEDAKYIHAEQALLAHLTALHPTDSPISAGRDVLVLGISKLACRTCDECLVTLSKSRLVYRGTSGIQFNQTINTKTGAKAPCGSVPAGTPMPPMLAEASDSEPDDAPLTAAVHKRHKQRAVKQAEAKAPTTRRFRYSEEATATLNLGLFPSKTPPSTPTTGTPDLEPAAAPAKDDAAPRSATPACAC